jgi:hypothetical protein
VYRVSCCGISIVLQRRRFIEFFFPCVERLLLSVFSRGSPPPVFGLHFPRAAPQFSRVSSPTVAPPLVLGFPPQPSRHVAIFLRRWVQFLLKSAAARAVVRLTRARVDTAAGSRFSLQRWGLQISPPRRRRRLRLVSSS